MLTSYYTLTHIVTHPSCYALTYPVTRSHPVAFRRSVTHPFCYTHVLLHMHSCYSHSHRAGFCHTYTHVHPTELLLNPDSFTQTPFTPQPFTGPSCSNSSPCPCTHIVAGWPLPYPILSSWGPTLAESPTLGSGTEDPQWQITGVVLSVWDVTDIELAPLSLSWTFISQPSAPRQMV